MKTLKAKHTCVITPTYPDKYFIERGAFVERLVKIWMAKGVEVDVIAPRSVQNICRSYFKTRFDTDDISGSSVHYPTYLSLSNKTLGDVDLSAMSHKQFNRAALRTVKSLKQPGFYYGQFLLTGGLAVIGAKNLTGKPAFIDVGESVLIDKFTRKEYKTAVRLVKQADGLLCVSDKLKQQIIELGATKDKVVSFPNTVDLARFYPMDKQQCRQKLGIPQDLPLVIFTGHFIPRKGPLRVLEAIQQTETDAKAVFLGRGPQTPTGEKVYYTGPVPNSDVPLWLSASDIFVLPTLSEGHCNAINEAMACGLPVVSSNIPEVRVQVPREAGVLADPENISELSRAIEMLLSDDAKRKEMGLQAAAVQKKKSAVSRAESVLEWISARLEKRDLQ